MNDTPTSASVHETLQDSLDAVRNSRAQFSELVIQCYPCCSWYRHAHPHRHGCEHSRLWNVSLLRHLRLRKDLSHYRNFCRSRTPLNAMVSHCLPCLHRSGSHHPVASRTIPWISGASLRLDGLLQRGLSDGTPLAGPP